MQRRQPRLGDILDDYCPRERRVTNHAVVAMIGDDVKQTRCTTCDAEHEYKKARVPTLRRRKEAPAALYEEVLAGATAGAAPSGARSTPGVLRATAAEPAGAEAAGAKAGSATSEEAMVVSDLDRNADENPDESPDESNDVGVGPGERSADEPEGPVHRRLIRATLPRTEATMPVRQAPEFTIRQTNGRHGYSGQSGNPGNSWPGPSSRPRAGGAGPAQGNNGGPRQAGRSRPGGRGNPQGNGAQHPNRSRPSRRGKRPR